MPLPMESSLASLTLKTKNDPVSLLKVNGARVLERFGNHEAEIARVPKLVIEIGETAINFNAVFGVNYFFVCV